MNPNDPIVQTVARTFDAFTALSGMDEEGYRPSEVAVDLALAILFDLAKTGVKLVHPDDVIENESDKDAGTVRLLLKAE